jgi:hypothetical protein
MFFLTKKINKSLCLLIGCLIVSSPDIACQKTIQNDSKRVKKA